jgi:hypothetical protein
MLSFATELPVDRNRDVADFLRTIQTWILGSPHTRLTVEDLAELASTAESHIKRGIEGLDAVTLSVADEQAAAIRYTRNDQDLEWTTTAVFWRRAIDSWVGIKVSRESRRPAVRLPPAKKPVLVRTLLDAMGGAPDGSLRVDGRAYRLENVDIDLAARVITGKAGCRLPIVYVSAGFQGRHVLDPDRLARELAGMAHVVVEPNRPFSLRLKIEVASENVYGGTIGIYWPEGGGRRSFFIGQEYASGDEVAQAIFEELRTALTNRRSLDRCTWAYVQESVSRQAIQTLWASGSQEVDKYIEKFDRELEAKTQRLDDANREISRLQRELQIHETRLKAGTGGLLQGGGEQDLFPNEVLSIVRQAIADASTRVGDDSRRKHVLDAVLDATPEPEDLAASMREKLKELLRGTRGLNATMRRGLEEMGFSITEEGRHYKLTFRDDDRYTFTLPKSGGDHRGGLNAASDIGRLLF